MPGWTDMIEEFNASAATNNGKINADVIRRRYVLNMAQATGRSVIVYYTNWFTKGGNNVSINLQDMQGMMEACRGLPGPALDVVLHSPGGNADSASSIVQYLRQKYTDVRVFVPLAAMSAATMWALAANRIVMGTHSQLGPIDPQVTLTNGGIPMPAKTILDQFEDAKADIAANPGHLGAWAPIIAQYGPGLLQMCQVADSLSKGLVEDWLAKYMFAGDPAAQTRAHAIAEFFGNYTQHKSHGIGIFRDQAKAQGLVIDDLEDPGTNPPLQDIVLSVHHACMATFNFTNCVKLIENNLGRGFYVQESPVIMPSQFPFQLPIGVPQPPVPQPPPGAPPTPQP